MNVASNNLVIDGSTTMTGNSGRVGGAIYTTGISSIDITGATMDSNYASSHGGAIYMTASTGDSIITNTSIDGNTANSGGGGGLYLTTSLTASFTLTDVTVDNNTLNNTSIYDGGGIYIYGENVTFNINGGSVSGNTGRGGGGIYSRNGVDMVISGATINNNSASNAGFGGGILSMASAATLTISNSYIQGNSTLNGGGGVYIGGGTTATITNTLISGNRQHTTNWRYGGGVYNSGTLYIYNSTIAGNYAYRDGGGIYAGGTETVRNTIIYGNTADIGSNDDVYLSFNTSTNNNIGNNARFVDLQQATSGTATTAGDYRLCYGSGNPAAGCTTLSPDLDMGNATNAPSDDIVGTARPEDIAGVGDGIDDYDRGAYEYFTPDLIPPANVTGLSVANPAIGNQLNLLWTNPGDSDFAGVKIVRATGGTAPANCSGSAVYDGAGTSYNDTGLIDGTQYSYRICSYDTVLNYASGVTGSSTPTDTIAPANVTGLSVNESNSTIDLTWTNPVDADYTGTKILRKTGGYPSSCADGSAITVYDSAGTSHSDTGLSNGTTYYYRVCAHDSTPNYPSGVTVTGTPFVDVTPPAAVSDLVASAASTTSVDLGWTAPGDDGSSGTAASYDVRYSTSSITEGNWASATQVTGEPVPSVAATAESMIVTGFDCETQYFFAIKTTDEEPNTSPLSNVISKTTSVCASNGMLVYGDTTAGTVKYRSYDYANGLSVEAAANTYAGTTTYVNVVESPTRNEFMMVSTHSSQPMYVQLYDGSSWNYEWDSGASISGSSRNFFNVAYEQNTGDALVVYENESTSNFVVAYRTFNGTTWSGQQLLYYSTLLGFSTGVITRVNLYPKAYSDEILLVMIDSASKIYAFIWNGTEFVNGKTITTSRNASSSTNQVASGTWEGISGEAMVAYSDNLSAISYATFDGTTWSSDTQAFDLNGSSNFAPHVQIDGDRTSDNIAFIASVTSVNTVEARIWTGSAWEASPPTPGNKGIADVLGVSVAWEGSGGKALFAWTNNSTTSNNISYMTYTTGGTGWSTANMNSATMTGDWGGSVDYLELYADKSISSSNIMMVGVDGWNDGRAFLWNGVSWSNPNNYLYDTNVSTDYSESSAFAWDVLTSAPANITGIGVAVNAEGSRLDLSWTNPTDPDFAGVKIVRATGAVAPSDCDGTSVYIGAGTSFINTLLTDGTEYSYRLCSFDTGGNYASGHTGSGTPADTTAPANVTGLSTSVASAKILLAWTNPNDGDYAATMVLRKTGGYPSSCTDGTATTVYNSAGTSYMDTGLNNGTAYYYRLCSYDEVPLYPSGATITATPNVDITPPAEATGFSVTDPATGGQLDLSWTNPVGSDFTGVKIFRAEGATPPSDCSGSGAIYIGSGSAYNDTPVTNSQQYSYRLCTYDLSNNTSSGVTGSDTPTDTVATANVDSFAAAVGDTQLTLTWTNPSASDFMGTRILRKAGGYPSSCADGAATTVYDGTALTYVDTGLVNGTPYYYMACAYDGVPNYPSGVTATATPDGADVVAPERIDDLSVPTYTVTTINLTFTAPGDDDATGTAASYDIRYSSTLSISDSTWAGSTQMTGEPTPGLAGESESIELTGLTCGTTYSIAIKTIDEVPHTSTLSNVIQVMTTSCYSQQKDGMVVYAANADSTTPQYRSYTPTGGFSTESSTNTNSGSLSISILKEAPTRDEYMLITSHSGSYFYVQRYNGSSWSSEWQDGVSVSGMSRRNYFNIEYEQNSGDALVVYEYMQSNDRTVAYRTYNGSTWSSEQILDYSGLSGSSSSVVHRVKLYSKKDSNEILLVMLDNDAEVYAYIWNGSSFVNGKTITINRNAASGTSEVIGGAWESLSGEALVAYGDYWAAVSYATFNGSTWSNDLQSFYMNGSTNDVEHIDLASDPTSDYIGLIEGSTYDEVHVRMWTGSAWEGSPPAKGDKGLALPIVSVAWLGQGGKALFVWSNGLDYPNLKVEYMTYTVGIGWSISDMTTAPTIGEWGGIVNYLELFSDRATNANQIMLVGLDSSSDARSIVWTDGTWSSPTNTLHNATITFNNTEAAAFAWEYTTTLFTDVSGFTVSPYAPGDRIDLSWTNPADLDFAYVKVVRATGAVAPSDCSSGTQVYIGSNESFNDTGIPNGTQYSYRICAYNTGTLSSAGVTGSATAGDTAPPADVTLFSAVPTNATVTLSWTNPVDADYAGTKVLRKTGGYPSSCTDGTATTVYNNNGTTHTDTPLTNGTQYYYRACSYDGAPNYPTGVTVSATPVLDATPPADVTGFTVSNLGFGNQLTLSWTNPVDGDFSAVKIVRDIGGTAPSDCTASAVYNGPLTAYTDTSVSDGTLYSYRICSYDYSHNYATGVTDNATPTDTLAPSSIIGLTLTLGNTDVTFNWINPVETDFAGTKVLRKTDTYPASCTDGTATTVYNSTGTTFVDTGLINNTAYYYIGCAYDEIPNYATSVAAMAIPSGDTTSPAQITDLSSIAVYTRGIKLSWTAPGDDEGTGTASTYDLRYTDAKDFASEMKTYLDIDWGNLDQVDDEPTPQAAGTTETHFFGKNIGNVKVLPNTSYYSVIKSKDDLDNPSVISNEVNVHTALKYGYNYMSLPFDASTGMSATLQNLLGDDVSYVYIFKWTPTGLDWGSRFRGRWTRLSSSAHITAAISNGSGYYMYVYSANFSVLDEQDSGGSAVVSENTDSWAKVDMVQGRNLVGNPYTKNVNFSTIKVCQNSTFTTSGGCSGGTIKTFIEAVTAGWMGSTVAYYGNATTFTTETCSSIECVAKLRPWWGQWVYLLQNSDTYIMAVPKP